MKEKVDVTITIEEDHLEWILSVTEKYDLSDESKTFRVLLDYAI